MKFQLFDIEFKIEYSLFIILLIALFAKNDDLLYLILFSSLHEVGHVLSLYLLGGKAEKITFAYYGIGMVRRGNLNFLSEIIFLLSGIVINSLFVIFNFQRKINFCLLLINILPIYPLDAGRCVKLILDRVFDINISYKLYFSFSVICFVALLIFSLYVRNFNLILICVYLFFQIIRGNYD